MAAKSGLDQISGQMISPDVHIEGAFTSNAALHYKLHTSGTKKLHIDSTSPSRNLWPDSETTLTRFTLN